MSFLREGIALAYNPKKKVDGKVTKIIKTKYIRKSGKNAGEPYYRYRLAGKTVNELVSRGEKAEKSKKNMSWVITEAEANTLAKKHKMSISVGLAKEKKEKKAKKSCQEKYYECYTKTEEKKKTKKAKDVTKPKKATPKKKTPKKKTTKKASPTY